MERILSKHDECIHGGSGVHYQYKIRNSGVERGWQTSYKKKKKRKEKQQMVTNIVLQAIWSFWKLLNVAPVVL